MIMFNIIIKIIMTIVVTSVTSVRGCGHQACHGGCPNRHLLNHHYYILVLEMIQCEQGQNITNMAIVINDKIVLKMT